MYNNNEVPSQLANVTMINLEFYIYIPEAIFSNFCGTYNLYNSFEEILPPKAKTEVFPLERHHTERQM